MKIFSKIIRFRWSANNSNSNSKLNMSIQIDDKLLFSGICLMAIGIIMIYSASIAYASYDKKLDNQYYYLIRHLCYLFVGVVSGITVFNIPTSFWKKYSNHIALLILAMLIIVLIPYVGRTVNGATRWIGIGAFNLQPSELAKLGVIIFLAKYACNKVLSFKKSKKDIIFLFSVICIIDLLLLIEPDMGSATVVFIIALGILFMAGMDKKIVFNILGFGIIGFVALVLFEPYRMRRIIGFINPWDDALGKGYQLTHSLLAIGHGSWFGVGVGNSIEKLFYLPEAHTDFILAIIGEETGMLGIGVILFLFWMIFYRGFNVIGSETERYEGRKFQALMAQGISLWFFTQALVNVGVAVGILPTKGLTLPFVSFGGSSILVSCISLAILLKVDYENKQIKRGIIIS